MPSVLIAAVPIHGHVSPLLAVARHLVERGDRVRFLTGSRFAERVEAVGAEHVSLPAPADFDDRQDWNTILPERANLKGAKAIAHDIEHIFVRPGRAQYEAIMTAHAAEPVDVVLADPVFTGGALLLGHPRGERPPIVVCGVVPLPIRSRDTAPYGMGLVPLGGPLGRLRNTVLARVADRVVFADAVRIADEINHDLHGAPPAFPVLDWPRHAEAIVQFTVPGFEYPRSDAPASLHFAGPISPADSLTPLPEWWPDLDGTRPVVHVTQGTLANRDYGQIIAPTLTALASDDLLVVVSTGGRPLDTLPPLPPNARAAEYLPYDELLPKTDLFVTNGGYGGVQYALRHGVPIVTSGGQEDKPEVAARVAWSGVGRRIRAETPSPAVVRKSVRAALRQPRYRDAARRIATQMSAAGGIGRLAEILDDVVATAGVEQRQSGCRESRVRR